MSERASSAAEHGASASGLVGPRVVVAGGHSAGHIEPALNFADALRRLAPDAEVTALGTERGLDTTLIPARGYPLELIPPVPLPRRPGRVLLSTPARLLASVRAAGAVLRRTRAEAVVGFGGYVAMPAYLAARRAGTPIVLHEANARPGVANRVAARLTPHVYTASAGVHLPHATAIGIPLRPAIASLDRTALRAQARAHFGLAPDAPVLLVTGGSQGARSLNAAVAAARPALRSAGVQVLHVVGPANLAAGSAGPSADAAATGADDPGAARYVALPFVERMDLAYAAADFALCRCGAMTCAELAAVGLPAAFVPLPLRGGEQRHNAEAVVAAGGGLLVADEDLDADWITHNVVPAITAPEIVERMSHGAARLGCPDAADDLARRVLELIARRRAGGGR